MAGRIYFMGELALDISLEAGGKARWSITDRLVGAAMELAGQGHATAFLSEAATDCAGDFIAGALSGAGTDISGVDRYTEGLTPVRVGSAGGTVYSYEKFPAEGFNPVWPRINEGDMIVWGSFFSLDKRVHQMVTDIVKYARARKAVSVYVPYFHQFQVSRITRVMPEVFDCLELADAVIATVDDMEKIFGSRDMALVYRNNLNFYTSRFTAIDTAAATVTRFAGNDAVTVTVKGGTPLARILAEETVNLIK